MINITMSPDRVERLERLMSGEFAEELIDVITDEIVLSSSIPSEQKAGAGHVLKFLRSLSSGDNLHVTKREEPSR